MDFKTYVRTVLKKEVPKDNIPGSWFVENHLPMIVRCTCCEMTMALPSAWIDEDGNTYCAECAGMEE